MTHVGSTDARGATPPRPASGTRPGIEGKLGTRDIVLATMAYTGPLTGTAGYITFIIAYGNGLGAPATFIPVALALLLFAFGYGAMTRFVPNPGAFYAYITAGLGRIAGLGSAFLIMGAYLAIGVGFYGFAGLIAQQFIVGHGGPELPWWLMSLIFWAIVATLAYFHIAVSAKVLAVLLIAEIIVIAIFDGAVFAQGGPEGISTEVFTWGNFTSGELGIALVFAAALFAGFEATAIYREEARDPERTIPRATIIVALFIGGLYIITSWALITGLGTSQAIEKSAADPSGAFFVVANRFRRPGVLRHRLCPRSHEHPRRAPRHPERDDALRLLVVDRRDLPARAGRRSPPPPLAVAGVDGDQRDLPCPHRDHRPRRTDRAGGLRLVRGSGIRGDAHRDVVDQSRRVRVLPPQPPARRVVVARHRSAVPGVCGARGVCRPRCRQLREPDRRLADTGHHHVGRHRPDVRRRVRRRRHSASEGAHRLRPHRTPRHGCRGDRGGWAARQRLSYQAVTTAEP